MNVSKQKQELTNRAKELIKQQYTEKFSLDKLAGQLYVNKSYLARVFREVTGYTPLWYHNFLRCEAAKDLLVSDDYCISIIASRTGFTSPSHFTRTFRSITGCTPSEYRKHAWR